MNKSWYVKSVFLLIGVAIGLIPSQMIALKTFRMERLRSEKVFLIMSTAVGQTGEDVAKWLGSPYRVFTSDEELRRYRHGSFVPSRAVEHEVWLYLRKDYAVYVYLSKGSIIQTAYIVPVGKGEACENLNRPE